MSKKILIVGGVAGGASTATRLRRIDEDAEITMYERGPHVSFSNCSLPFYLSGIVEKSDNLVLMSPERFKNQYNITAKVNHEVIKINPENKTIDVENLNNGDITTENYDVLMLSPGANPIRPNIQGINNPNVFTVRNVPDVTNIKNYLENNEAKEVAIVGGGFIGIEVAENLHLAGYKITIIEALDQILNNFDYDMVQILHKEMMDKGINLVLSDAIAKIADDKVELASGKELPADAVIMAIGVSPETSLAKDAGLEIGVTGGIKVNTSYKTSDPNIYAVGDAIEVFHSLTNKPTRLAMAGPAQMQARSAANHMYGENDRVTGVIGSLCLQVLDYNAAATGLNEKQAKAEEIPYDFAYIIASDKFGLMPDANPIHLKLLFEVPTGRILGAQAIGKGNVTKRIDVIATMISMKGNLEDLRDLELCYSPLYSTAKDPVNVAALVGLNLLFDEFKQVPVYKTRELVESKAMIIDVREPDELKNGHIVNAINIPLSQLRERIYEIPKDKPVYLHCRSSQRSYNACRALQNEGYDNVYNISGSFLGISLYEYFNDKTLHREPIMTKYNFR